MLLFENILHALPKERLLRFGAVFRGSSSLELKRIWSCSLRPDTIFLVLKRLNLFTLFIQIARQE